MVTIILVVYYPDYLDDALRGILRFARLLALEFRVIVVNNNAELKIAPPLQDVSVLNGSNLFEEFSGWEEGLRHTKSFSDTNLFVFANDTFSRHRPWTPNLSYRFQTLCRNAIRSQTPILGGEMNSFSKEFSILGITTHAWISTYMFAMNRGAIEALNFSLFPPTEVLERALRAIDADELFEIFDYSPELTEHVTNWLQPKDTSTGWYGATTLNATTRIRKLKAISFEKYLSAKAAHAGVTLDSIDNSLLNKMFHKLQARLGVLA